MSTISPIIGAAARALGGGVGTALWTSSMAVDMVGKLTPQLYHVAEVTIQGKPFADIEELYLFAICVASGVIAGSNRTIDAAMPRNSDQIFEGRIDYQNKIVIITIGFEASGLQTAPDDRDVVRLPIDDPLLSDQYPKFIRKGPVEAPIVPVATTILETTPGDNPGLSFQRGTIDKNNSIANSGFLIDPTKDVPSPAGNEMTSATLVAGVWTGGDLTVQTRQALAKIFGFVA